MKRHLLLLLAITVLLGSCTKVVLTDQNRISGRWVLLYAEKQNNYGTSTVYTGFENGLFYFYENGGAEYEDAVGPLRGSWSARRVNDGYYDSHGDYHNGSRQLFDLYLADYQGYPVLDWKFDDSWFSGSNRFIATYDTYNYTYRYVFARQ